MSFGVVVKSRHGLALASDSRCGVFHTDPGNERATVSDDAAAVKLISFPAPHTHVAMIALGATVPMAMYKTFTNDVVLPTPLLPASRGMVLDYAESVSAWLALWEDTAKKLGVLVLVAGFDPGEDRPDQSKVYAVGCPTALSPVELHAGGLGFSYGGQREFVDRLLLGYDPRLPNLPSSGPAHFPSPGADFTLQRIGDFTPALQVAVEEWSLGDSVDFATFLTKFTIDAQRFSAGYYRGTGGRVHAATITPAAGFVAIANQDAPPADAPVECQQYAITPWVAGTYSITTDLQRPATYDAPSPERLRLAKLGRLMARQQEVQRLQEEAARTAPADQTDHLEPVSDVLVPASATADAATYTTT